MAYFDEKTNSTIREFADANTRQMILDESQSGMTMTGEVVQTQAGESAFKRVAYVAGGIAAGLADWTLDLMPDKLVGDQSQWMGNAIKSLGATRFGEYYQKNRSSFMLAGDAALFLIPPSAAARAVGYGISGIEKFNIGRKAVTAGAEAIENSSILSRIFTPGRRLADAQALHATELGNAMKAVGPENLLSVPSYIAAANDVKIARASKLALEGVVGAMTTAAAFQLTGRAGNPDALVYQQGLNINEFAIDAAGGAAIGWAFGMLQGAKATKVALANAKKADEVANPSPLNSRENMGNVLRDIHMDVEGSKRILSETASTDGELRTVLDTRIQRGNEVFTQQVANTAAETLYGISNKIGADAADAVRVADALRDERRLTGVMGEYRTYDTKLDVDEFIKHKDASIADIRAKMNAKDVTPAARDVLVKELDDVMSSRYTELSYEGIVHSGATPRPFQELDRATNTIRKTMKGDVPRYHVQLEGKDGFSIGADGLSGVGRLSKLSTVEATGYYAAQKMWLDDFLVDPSKHVIAFADDAKQLNHMDLDLYNKAAQLSDPAIREQILAATKMDSVEALEMATIHSKFDALKDMLKSKRTRQAGADSTDWLDMQRRLNLNLVNPDGSPNEIAQYFGSVIVGKSNLRKEARTIEELNGRVAQHAHMQVALATGDAGEALAQRAVDLAQRGFKYEGDMLTRPYDKGPIAILSAGSRHVIDPVQAQTFSHVNEMKHELLKARIVRTTDELKHIDPSLNVVGNVYRGLMEGQHAQTAEHVRQMVAHVSNGIVSDPVIKQLGRLSTQQTQSVMRHIPFARAAQTGIEAIERESIAAVRPKIDELRSLATTTFTPGSKELAGLNDYIAAMRSGFDIEDLSAMTLRDTPRNREIIRSQFGGKVEFTPGMQLPSSLSPNTYVPINLGDKTKQFLQAKDALNQAYAQQWNAVAKSAGHRAIEHRAGYVEPINLANRNVVFLQGADGRVVDYAYGVTHEEAMKNANVLAESMRKNGAGTVAITNSDNIAEWYALKNEAFSKNMLDFTKMLNQTGQKKPGQMAALVDNPQQMLSDMVNSLTSNYIALGKYAREVYFAPEMRALELANDMSINSGRLRGIGGAPSARNEYQLAQDLILQRSSASPGSLYGVAGSTMDKLFNSAATAVLDSASRFFPSTPHLGKKNAMAMEQYAKSYSDELAKQGFPNVAEEMMRNAESRITGYKVPLEVRNFAHSVNAFTAMMNLQLLSLGSSVMNFAGLFATVPGVMAALKRKPGEDAVTWGARTGGMAHVLDDEGVAQLNPVAGLKAYYKRFLSGDAELKQAFKVAKEKGDLGGSGDYHALMEEMFTDSPATRGGQLAKKSAEWLNGIANWSEEKSRGLAYGLGWTIAREAGASEAASRVAALQFADLAIANYSSFNKPDIYKSAVGSVFGLFQTYSTNYWQRLLNATENADMRTLATQVGAQSVFFGLRSVPGFAQLNEAYSRTHDGMDFEDYMSKRLGKDGATVLQTGALSNMTRLFGGQDGIAMTSRASVTVPVPAADIMNTPAVQMFSNLGAMSKKMYESMRVGGASPERIVEIFSAYFPQREAARLAEQYLGYSVDRSGRMIDVETDGMTQTMASVLGMRTIAEDELRRNSYKMRADMRENREEFTELSRNLRSKYRSGNVSEADLEEFYTEYTRSGRDPAKFRTWLKTTLVKDDVDGEGRIVREIGNNEKLQKLGALRFAMHEQ